MQHLTYNTELVVVDAGCMDVVISDTAAAASSGCSGCRRPTWHRRRGTGMPPRPVPAWWGHRRVLLLACLLSLHLIPGSAQGQSSSSAIQAPTGPTAVAALASTSGPAASSGAVPVTTAAAGINDTAAVTAPDSANVTTAAVILGPPGNGNAAGGDSGGNGPQPTGATTTKEAAGGEKSSFERNKYIIYITVPTFAGLLILLLGCCIFCNLKTSGKKKGRLGKLNSVKPV